jgi:hypothetical protein
MTPVLAHLGHWYQAAPFFGPVGLIAVWVSIQSARDRRRGDS